MADYLHVHGHTHSWDIEFSQSVQDWEVAVVDTFMEVLYSNHIHIGKLDYICWNLSTHETL